MEQIFQREKFTEDDSNMRKHSEGLREIIRKNLNLSANEVINKCKEYLHELCGLKELGVGQNSKLTWACFRIYNEELKKKELVARGNNYKSELWSVNNRDGSQVPISVLSSSVACLGGIGMFFGDNENGIMFVEAKNKQPRKIWQGESGQEVTALRPISENRIFSAIWAQNKQKGMIRVHNKSINNMWNNTPDVLFDDCLQKINKIELERDSASNDRVVLVDDNGKVSLLKKKNAGSRKWEKCESDLPIIKNINLFDSLMPLSDVAIWAEKNKICVAKNIDGVWSKDSRDLFFPCATCDEITAVKLSLNIANQVGKNSLVIYSGGSSGCLWMWKLVDDKWTSTEIGKHKQKVSALCVLRNGDLISADKGGMILQWYTDADEWKNVVIGSHAGIREIKLLLDGSLLSVGSNNDRMRWSNI